jgi:glycine hydroxymethyltransferase
MGHLTHGHPLNFSGINTRLPLTASIATQQIDYDELQLIAEENNRGF